MPDSEQRFLIDNAAAIIDLECADITKTTKKK
jgi:hypothetical protein